MRRRKPCLNTVVEPPDRGGPFKTYSAEVAAIGVTPVGFYTLMRAHVLRAIAHSARVHYLSLERGGRPDLLLDHRRCRMGACARQRARRKVGAWWGGGGGSLASAAKRLPWGCERDLERKLIKCRALAWCHLAVFGPSSLTGFHGRCNR